MAKAILTNADIYHIWRYGKCIYEARKWERSPFCSGCYADLSRETKTELTRKFGQGFERAFRKALTELNG